MMAFAFSSIPCLPSLSIPERMVGLKAGAFARQSIHIHKIRKPPMFRAVLGSNPSKNAAESSGTDVDLAPPGCSRFKVELSKPLGVVLEEDKSGNIFVAELVKDGNADKSGLVDIGDQLIATSAVVYANIEDYQGVRVRKGMVLVRLNVRGERFETPRKIPKNNGGHTYYLDGAPTPNGVIFSLEFILGRPPLLAYFQHHQHISIPFLKSFFMDAI